MSNRWADCGSLFGAAGDSGKAALAAIDRVTPEIAGAQAQIDRAIASAAQAQNAMDGYDGLPTTAQFRQIDWAWEDAAAAANALNKVIRGIDSGGVFIHGRSGEAGGREASSSPGPLTYVTRGLHRDMRAD